jgi:DNA-binding NarL/FixJ family response regulator
MRVVIADDAVLMREGLARLLRDAGVEVSSTVSDADALYHRVRLDRPDVAIVDIRMPPTHTQEGLVAAQHLREEHRDLAVLVLSNHIETRYALELLEGHPERLGYLLKERVSDIAVLVDSLSRLSDGECVIDPTIVAQLLSRRRRVDPLEQLTARERDVLALMAEGRSNTGIAAVLVLTPRTVETHVRNIFAKLGLQEAPANHRRVLAVLQFLRS